MFKYFSWHSVDRAYVGIWFAGWCYHFRCCHFESLRSERARDIFYSLFTLIRFIILIILALLSACISTFPELLKFVMPVIICLPYCTVDIYIYIIFHCFFNL